MILHISHNDLDGVSCGILTKKFLKNVYNYYCNYNEIDDFLMENAGDYSRIIISDMCASRHVIENAMGEAEITVIDHHVSSEWVKEYPDMVHSLDACASKLTLLWLKEQGYDVKDYEDYIDCVNDFDLWLLKREDSLEMNMLFMKLGISRFEERFLEKPYFGFGGDEKLILELETERRDRYIRNGLKSAEKYIDTNGLEFAVVFCEEYNSELGNELINDLGVDYCVLINMQRRKVSLRSRKDIDVGSMAEDNGGGGHKNAAGFQLTSDFCMEDFLKEAGFIK